MGTTPSSFNAVLRIKTIYQYVNFCLGKFFAPCRFSYVLHVCRQVRKKVILMAEILLAVFAHNHETGSFSMVTEY